MSDKVTPETLTREMIRDAMALGDTPVTGNGFVRACQAVLGVRGWGAFVPTSVNESIAAERRVCQVINACRDDRRIVDIINAGQVKDVTP